MSGVALVFLAMAAGAAAAPVDQDEAGGQDGSFRVKLFEPGEEMAPNESGMFWYFHAWSSEGLWPFISDMYYYLTDMTRKIVRAKKDFLEAWLR